MSIVSSSSTLVEEQYRPRKHNAEPSYPKVFSSDGNRLGFGEFSQIDRSAYAECDEDDIITTSYGTLLMAEMRWKLHKMRKGRKAEAWDTYLNKTRQPGDPIWAPRDSPLVFVPKSSMAELDLDMGLKATSTRSSGSTGDGVRCERRSSL